MVFHHGFGTIHQRAPSYGVNTLAELGREYGIWYYSPKSLRLVLFTQELAFGIIHPRACIWYYSPRSLYWYDCQLPNYDVNMVFHHAFGTIHPTA